MGRPPPLPGPWLTGDRADGQADPEGSTIMDAATARRLLEAERERLQTILDQTAPPAEAPGPAPPAPGDTADVGARILERELADSLQGHTARALRDVADALERLDRDRYGLCESCGGPIHDERLTARPAARTCVLHADTHTGAGTVRARS